MVHLLEYELFYRRKAKNTSLNIHLLIGCFNKKFEFLGFLSKFNKDFHLFHKINSEARFISTTYIFMYPIFLQQTLTGYLQQTPIIF